MLVSTHDLRWRGMPLPRMVMMDEGCIMADGLTQELLANDDLLAAHGLEKV